MSASATLLEIRSARVAKLENGYTRIANELLEVLANGPFTLRQLRIVLEIARLTYGYRKRTVLASTDKIATACKMQKNHARSAIAELLTARVLFREGGHKGAIGINNHIDEWIFAPDLGANNTQTFAPDFGANAAPDLGANAAPDLGANPPNTPYSIKENFKEKGKESKNPSPPSDDLLGIQPRQIVEIWNQKRPGSAICPILPPKQQTAVQETLGFVAKCFGQTWWPKHAADVLPWFADFFASVEACDQGDYFQQRDFFYFMDSSRLYSVLEENHRHG